MDFEKKIKESISQAFTELFEATVAAEDIQLQPTRKDFEGSVTFVIFPYLKLTRKKPEETGQLLGEYLVKNLDLVTDFNVVKGFLNLCISEQTWVKLFSQITQDTNFGFFPANGEKVMVEYSSPNTNKPLHLGHLRNNFLGYSVSQILAANGYDVLKVNLVNDRGIHICKSMVAYKKFGNGETPTPGRKGDKLVGDFYVKFDQEYKKEIAELLEQYKAENPGIPEKELKAKAEKEAPILKEAQDTLRKWEQGDEATVTLWKKMNSWVYDGFDFSYKLMGVTFDKYYYESNTYLLGKDIVEEGQQKGVFYQKEDNSVWVDLSEEGLDEKLLLRGDGTSVYMTQDMGTADLKFKDWDMTKSIYVVGNEQDYHFKVLSIIMKKLDREYAEGIYHLSYGMVDLPSGKMKSREGTVVDADDLIFEMIDTAKERTATLGKIEEFDNEEAQALYRMLALGALKYYLLRVDPKKRILFNPQESVDFQGNTGVYIQYNHAKICAIVRKAERDQIDYSPAAFQSVEQLHGIEVDVIDLLSKYPEKIQEAGREYAPSIIANYAYELSKAYSKFYAELPIFGEQDEAIKSFRVALSKEVAKTIEKAMKLLGTEVPERM
ncbi:arginine--tRNA ligase [Rapidithrix thailandica]|uniref:Arginine--tRNA ligase n=1 Tax=Rapidithrix thailandica TaxID=413964 RepID=A0AAW9SDG7_9BACT